MDLKGPSDFERLSQSILSQLNSISDQYPEVKLLCERIEKLQNETNQNCVCKVALVGFTKAGKSTLLSTLSGYEGLVPSKQGFLSVSYAPLELSFQADRFSLEIVYYTRKEILEQLQEDFAALFSVFKEETTVDDKVLQGHTTKIIDSNFTIARKVPFQCCSQSIGCFFWCGRNGTFGGLPMSSH